MKLLVVTESLAPRGGWGSYSLGLVRALETLGVQARVLVERRSEDANLPNVEQIPCLASPMISLVHPTAIVWNAAQLVRHARGSDLLHFMVEPYATASLPFGLPPSCITLHGTYAVSPFRASRLASLLWSRALRRASRVICVSRYTRDALLEKMRIEHVEIINNGHELAPADGAAEDELLVDGRPTILGVGALKPRKGYQVALRAIALLRERFPDLRYYLVGDDSDRAHVERLRNDIAELGLEHQAVIVGPVSDARLRAFYRQADLFLLTPINIGLSFEGFGIAYLEANAYGKPVVGSLGCGAEEAIDDGVTGLLAPQHDEAAVAERAARILADPTLAARLGAAGRARAEASTWLAVARRYLDVYEDVARGKS